MAKIAAAAAAALCLAALVAVAVGQGEVERQRLKDLQCWQEVQESPLDACRQVLDRQLTGGIRYGVGPFRWGTGLRMRCCQQLQDVSRQCRCAAIRSMVRGYEETMPPLEKGWGRQQQQPQPGYYPCSEAGEGYGYGESGQQPMYPPCRPGIGRKIARVRLTKARQYAAGMPMMCRLSEPQECNVFSGGDQYY
ncbi:19 kDa globulin-like [Miscanthus floridulus]|uniref:19 kDa globulin-like n=1 Tax=Miscanthus floridulus TaxID=154761 RepID=UPI0034587853